MNSDFKSSIHSRGTSNSIISSNDSFNETESVGMTSMSDSVGMTSMSESNISSVLK